MKTDYTMGKALHSLLVILFVLVGPLCYSQTSVKVSDPRLEIRDNKLHIYYDILNGDPDEKYIISIDIKDQDGNTMKANTLEGDIGEVVEGGNNKQITWNLAADNIFINSYVYIKINARVISPPAPVMIEPVEEQKQEVIQEEQKDQTVSKEELKSYNRAGIILQSLAVPGLGLSRISGKPHWLRGVAGYGCIAGSIILNRQAINTFNTIEDYENPNDASSAFDKSVAQDNISEVLAYAAIAVWVTDIIWTIAGTSDLNKPLYSHTAGFSLKSNIDPLSNLPMFGFTYRF
jgi:hypothetical protein